MIALEIHINSLVGILVVVYLPPPVSLALLDSLDSTLEHISLANPASNFFLLLGDFNIPSFNTTSPSNLANLLCSITDSFELTNYANFPTRGKNYLDLAFCSREISVCKTYPYTFSDHLPLDITLKVDTPISSIASWDTDNYSLNFKKCDLDGLNALMSSVDWQDVLKIAENDVNISVSSFYSIFNDFITKTTPSFKSINNGHLVPWWDNELNVQLNYKKCLHLKYKKSSSLFNYEQFSHQRKLFKQMFINKRLNYLLSIEDTMIDSNDSRPFWSFIKSSKLNSTTPNSMTYNDLSSSDPMAICQFFRDYFMSTFSNSAFNSSPTVEVHNCPQIPLPEITPNIIIDTLSTLSPKKSLSPDGIPSYIIPYLKHTLSVPLALIFNLSLKSGTFPDIFKKTFITPIFKKGSQQNVLSYRPIALLSHISKCFEKIIHRHICSYVSDLISPSQHGFIPKHSTVTNLLEFNHFIFNKINSLDQVDVIYTDFTKAFDRINHGLLICKLSAFNFDIIFLNWLKSYLTERANAVLFKGKKSSKFVPTSGVPQGSILGPLLFILFVNDIPSLLKNLCLFYADDLKIFKAIRSFEDCLNLNESLKILSNWCSKWDLQLNVTKCYHMSIFRNRHKSVNFTYTINSQPLNEVFQISDLGVLYTSSFSFNLHIHQIISKSFRMLGFIRRNSTSFTNMKTLLLLYKQLILPILDYCSPVWSPYTKNHVNALERVQRKFIKFLRLKFGHNYLHENYDQYLIEHSLNALFTRRILYNFKLTIHAYFNRSQIDPYNTLVVEHTPSFNSRSSKLYQLPFFHSNLYKLHPVFSILELCNSHEISLSESPRILFPFIKLLFDGVYFTSFYS